MNSTAIFAPVQATDGSPVSDTKLRLHALPCASLAISVRRRHVGHVLPQQPPRRPAPRDIGCASTPVGSHSVFDDEDREHTECVIWPAPIDVMMSAPR